MGICECIGDIDGVGGGVLYKESSLDVGILGNSRYGVFTDISFDA